MEYLDGAGEVKALGKVSAGRALLKEGEFVLYNGMKNGKPYIGSTTELLKRYSEKEIRDLGATIFRFFQDNPLIRMPNRGIAIGFEQMVIELNNGGESLNAANKASRLVSNSKNAAVKDIYLREAKRWAEKNIPNWQDKFNSTLSN